MGLFDFAANIGKKLFGSEDEGGPKIKEHIETDNPGIDGLQVEVKAGVAILSGSAVDQAAREKAILLAGNVAGVQEVNADKLTAPAAAASITVEYYEIQSGDSLSKIAKQFLGDANKYPEIFAANKEVIKDPDLIYPGQKIRIPTSAGAVA